MSALTTRDALAEALETAVSDLNNRGAISDGYGWTEIADALLASGAVIDAATLADVLDREGVGFKSNGWASNDIDRARLEALGWVIEWLRDGHALAAALTERGAKS